MNNRTYKLSNNFGVRIVVRENFLVSAALFRHIIRPVLRHTDAVTVAVCLKKKRTVLLFERKRRTSQRKKSALKEFPVKLLPPTFRLFTTPEPLSV